MTVRTDVAPTVAKYVVVTSLVVSYFATKEDAMEFAQNQMRDCWVEWDNSWPCEVAELVVAEVIARPQLVETWQLKEVEKKESTQ